MENHIDEKLLKDFCALISHQASLTEGDILDIPIEKILETLKPNNGGDFPLLGIKIPLGKLLRLNPNLGLTLLGYRRTFLCDNDQKLISVPLDEVAELQNYDQPENLVFKINIDQFNKGYTYHCRREKNTNDINKEKISIDFDYPIAWLSADPKSFFRFRKQQNNKILSLLKAFLEKNSLTLEEATRMSGYSKESSAMRAISDLNEHFKNGLKIEYKIINHDDAGYHLNTNQAEFQKITFSER